MSGTVAKAKKARVRKPRAKKAKVPKAPKVPMDVKESRDALRAGFFGDDEFGSELVKTNFGDVEVRQPSVDEKAKILKAAGVNVAGLSDSDITVLITYAAVACSYVPGTDVKIWDVTDLPAILEMPSNKDIDDLGEAAVRLMSVTAVAKAKN